jgi:hypothetical protein
VIASLLSAAKPSFLVYDRVFQKVTAAEEEQWLLRASEMTLMHVQTQLLKSEALRYILQESVPLSFCTHVTQDSARIGIHPSCCQRIYSSAAT